MKWCVGYMGPIYSIEDVLDLLRRRAALIALVTFVGGILSAIFALSEQHVYASTEVIQIQRPEIASSLAPSTVDGSAARRLQLIEQRLMTRGTILEVGEKFGFFDDMDGMTETEKVAVLRDAIEIDVVAAAAQGGMNDGSVSVVSILARASDPYLAQSLAQEFGARTVDLAAMDRLEQARATLDFFHDQEQKMLDEIAALEHEITEYRLNNDVAVQGAIDLRRSEVGTINSTLLEIERDRISVAQQMRQIDPNARQSTRERLMADYNADLDALDEQMRLLVERREVLLNAMKTSPDIERQLGIYDRQLTQLNDQLEIISQRLAEAEVSLRLEGERQAERMTVIEPASLPELPITPPRRNKAALGLFASFFVGAGLAFLLDILNPVLRSARQMEREIGIAPVVCIPVVEENRGRRRKRYSRKSVLASIRNYLRPSDGRQRG